MLEISPDKLVVVFVIALVVLGPGRLADAGRALGRARAQLSQLSSGLPPETKKLIRDPRGALFEALAEPRQAIADVTTAARASVSANEHVRGENEP